MDKTGIGQGKRCSKESAVQVSSNTVLAFARENLGKKLSLWLITGIEPEPPEYEANALPARPHSFLQS